MSGRGGRRGEESYTLAQRGSGLRHRGAGRLVLEQSGQALAKRWEKAVTAALLHIAGRPRAGSICHFPDAELSDMRRVPVAGFPRHLIFYQLRETEVLVLRVLHGARDLESFF